jgi:hypothetical protein
MHTEFMPARLTPYKKVSAPEAEPAALDAK